MTYTKALERFPTVRQSRLSTFDKCALMAHFEEEYRRDWSGHPQMRGKIMHRVFARALRVMHEHNERTIPSDAMLELLAEELRQADVDRECPNCGKEVVERRGGRCVCAAGHEFGSDFGNIPFKEIKDMRWVAIKWATDMEFDIDALVDIEKRLSMRVRYPDENGDLVGRVLTGQLDAMFVSGADDDEAIVIDWKDTWDLPGPADVGFEGYFQQRFYAWLVLLEYSAIERVTLREVYVRYSQVREATVYRSELEQITAELAALVERFDRAFSEEFFPPSPGRHCQLCPRPGSCPIFPGVRQEGAITDDAMARRYAGEANVARAALKQREEAMKAWASVRGPIELNSTPGRERAWGFRQRKRVSRPTREQLERAMYLYGSRVNLDELFKESVTTRFEPHRPEEIEPTADDAKLMSMLERSMPQQPSDQSSSVPSSDQGAE